MISPCFRFFLTTTFLFSASPLYAATEMSTASHEDNEVSIPDAAPVVEMTPVTPAAQLLGSKGDSAPAPVELSTNKKSAEKKAADKESDKKKQPPKQVGCANHQDVLRDVLAYVYDHHPQLLAEREKLKSIDETVSQAVSDFRPDISAGYSKGRERRAINGAPWSYESTTGKDLVVTQPIFSGLDGVAGFKAAKQRVQAARADLTALEQQLFFNTIVAYTGVVEAQSVLKLTQNNVDVLTKQRDATQVRFDVGELTKTDVSQASSRLATAKANEQQAVGDLSIARATFLRATGMPAPEVVGMPAVPRILPKSLEEASKLAHEASPTIEAAKHREKAFENDVNVRVGQILPDVSIQGAMTRSEGGSVFANKINDDALTLNVTIPLYQSGAEWSRLREARNVAAQARFNTLDTTLAVEQDVTSAWQNFVTAGSVITSTKAAADASGIALEGVRQETEFGVRTVLDVLDAEQEYLTTQVNLVRAIRNQKIQAYRLLASVGKLTARELTLPVKVYDPKEHYDSVKYQLLGW